MTLHVYNCETVTIRSEKVKRTKPDGVFYGLRLHMNTDQAITFWARSEAGLSEVVDSLSQTLTQPAREHLALPGQLSR
jgi:ABC-type transport system involved in cytochrome bd biosynthesis fused ATPase/permease subunit